VPTAVTAKRCGHPSPPTKNTGGGTDAGVATVETGVLEGKGKNKVFTSKTEFAQGDSIIIRATVLDDGDQPQPMPTALLR
jgi:hypothetical protein